MSLTQLLSTPTHMIWRESDAADFDGGASVSILTPFPQSMTVDHQQVAGKVTLFSVTGTPNVDTTFRWHSGQLEITLHNRAASGNKAAFTLDLWVADEVGGDFSPSISVVTATSEVPETTVLRFYVDGTAGSDAASGRDSWENAWKTAVKLQDGIAAANLAQPGALELVARVRGAFSNEDLFLLAQMQGISGLYIAHDFTDHTVNQTGTLNAVTVATEKHSITRLKLAGGITLVDSPHPTGDIGRTLKVINAAGDIEGTSTIIKVDAGNNYCWTTKQTYPAWVVGGDVCTVRIVSPSMSGLRDVGMMLGEPTRMRYAPSASTTFRRPTLVGLKCEVLNMTGPGTAFGCHVVGAVTYPIRSEMGINTGVVTTTGMSAAYIAIMEELGFTKGATGYCAIGNYVPSAATSCLYALGGYTSFYGYANQPPKIDQSAFCYVAVSNVPGTDSRQGGFAQFEYSISRGQCLVDVGGHGRFDRLSWDVPAAGIAGGLVLVQDGGRAVITANVEGDNDDGVGVGTTLYGIQCKLGGLITGAGVVGALKGKSGDLRVPNGRAIQTAAATIAARKGGGPDIYAGSLGQVELQDNVVKSATNPSGGGTAQPVLKWERGGRITQASGKAFTLPAGSGNHTTDYGATGAIDGDLMETCLGTLTGAGGGSTGVAATLRYGARLRHGGAGISGTSPLKLGAAAAQAWPANPKSDHGEANYEDCWIYPNVA